MGSLSDAFFLVLLGWVRSLANAIWAIITNERDSVLEWLGKYWIPVCLVLLGIGLVGDRLVWLIRWRPYHVWAKKARKALHMETVDVPDESTRKMNAVPEEVDPEMPAQSSWLPERPVFTAEDTRQMKAIADQVPDEVLGEYPGMKYDTGAADLEMTALYGRPDQAEDPKAKYAREMREYEVKRAQYEQDLAQWQREQKAAEQKRYERELDEYQTQRARYELDLVRYEQDKAAYERTYGAVPEPGNVQTAPGDTIRFSAPAQPGSQKSGPKASRLDHQEAGSIADDSDQPKKRRRQ